jgi:hypothetical protein
MQDQIYNDLKNSIITASQKLEGLAPEIISAGKQGYEIVKTRVLVESIIGCVITSILLIILAIVFNNILTGINSADSDINDKAYAVVVLIVFTSLFGLILLLILLSNLINMFSTDYVAFERIINASKK